MPANFSFNKLSSQLSIFAVMNLVIDIGNSLIKAAVFENQNLIWSEVFETISERVIENHFKKYVITSAIVSSVASGNDSIEKYLKTLTSCIHLNVNTPIPIKNNYSTPDTLGNDRLANVIGANALFPNKNVLVIDAGTCLKFDFINREGEYMGGAISPGLHMRYKALHQFTERLPLLEPVKNAAFVGNTTANSIHSGVVNGMLVEINGILNHYAINIQPLQVILCGGDLGYFSNHLKNNIFAAPHLTLQGLNEILLYNQ